jgi:hypothetical protein
LKVIIAGSRSEQPSPFAMANIVAASGFNVTQVFEGGARGVDRSARFWATSESIPVQTFEADWTTHGKAAGPIRNQAMLDAGADALIAVWDGESRGTADMIRRAERKGIPVHVYRTDGAVPSQGEQSK